MYQNLIDFIRNLDYAKLMIVCGYIVFTGFTGFVPAVALFWGFKKATSPLGKGENRQLKLDGKGVGFSIEKSLAINLIALVIAFTIFAAVSLFWANFVRDNFPIRFG
ncbi:MAG: hypothetical protein MUP45_01655 [Candidatus Marinimicrobia bacterium]|nr:hypothetical protein [Candidatus Neomarinimicrobiota bacterium]